MKTDIEALLAKKYAPAVLSRLSRMPSREQLSIASWFVKNPIGTNYALQILSYLEDLAKKTEKPPAQILTSALGELPVSETLPKELGRLVRDTLHYQLHPVSGEHQIKFTDFLEAVQLPEGIRLVPPKNFEGNQFRLEVNFSSREELKSRLNLVQESLEQDIWEGIGDF